MTPHAQDILEAMTDDLLLRVARRNAEALAAEQPQPPNPVPDSDLLMLMHGFKNVLKEVANGGDGRSEALFLDILIPAALGQGQPVSVIAGNSACFGVVLMDELRAHLPPERREAAANWLAAFFSRYVRQVIRKATAQ